MHHRIMARKERESKNEIAGFRGLKPLIPAISNASASEKQTPAQSLRALFTDDCLASATVGCIHAGGGGPGHRRVRKPSITDFRRAQMSNFVSRNILERSLKQGV